jgi:hypothetical protein
MHLFQEYTDAICGQSSCLVSPYPLPNGNQINGHWNNSRLPRCNLDTILVSLQISPFEFD